MGWTGEPDQDARNATLRAFYPTTDLVTAPDIIFFWVARMIMAGYEYMGEMPFRNVYYTGLIRDKQGRKMSKTLGNSPDPLDLIAEYGADALRFGVMRSAPLGQDILFDEQQVELGRNFCNKLWNACRFRQMQGGEVQGEMDTSRLRSDDKWILLRLHQCIKELDAAFAEFKFSEATKALYDFFWGDYCDYYVEATKVIFQGTDPAKKASALAVMDFVLSSTLRLFHPSCRSSRRNYGTGWSMRRTCRRTRAAVASCRRPGRSHSMPTSGTTTAWMIVTWSSWARRSS